MKAYFFPLVLTISFFFNSAHAQQMDSVKHAHGYLFYHAYGKGEPIILLTGGPGGSYRQLEEVAIRLGKNYRAILPEQRGSGRSIPTPYDETTVNLLTAREDILRLMHHLNLKQVILLGHSWGAMLSMSFASAYPDRVKGLILVDPGPHKMNGGEGLAFWANREVRLGKCERAIRDSLFEKQKNGTITEDETVELQKMELLPFVYHQEKLDSINQKVANANYKTSGLIMNSLSKYNYDMTASLPRFKRPIHIITGRLDPGAFASYEIKILMPRAELHWIEWAGHFPMYDEPETFYKTLFRVTGKLTGKTTQQ